MAASSFDPATHRVRRVLCFGAHPDDLDFGAAGTVAAWTAAGVEVSYCIMTDGDAGGFDPAHRAPDTGAPAAAGARGDAAAGGGSAGAMTLMRHAEQRQAAALVGVADVHFLGERDGYLEPSQAVVRQVVELIRRLRPDVVMAMHPERNWERIQKSHPDHLACGEAVTRAIYPAVENPYAYPELQAAGITAYKVPWLWFYGSPAERENHYTDVTDFVDLKIQALQQHISQHPDVAAMEGYVKEQMRVRAAEAGFAAGRSAESFHVVAVNTPETIAGF